MDEFPRTTPFFHSRVTPEKEVLGQSFKFLMAHAADADALALIQAEFVGKTNGGSAILYRRKDGSEFWAALFISPVRDERGDVFQYFASFVSLTKHKDDKKRRPGCSSTS